MGELELLVEGWQRKGPRFVFHPYNRCGVRCSLAAASKHVWWSCARPGGDQNAGMVAGGENERVWTVLAYRPFPRGHKFGFHNVARPQIADGDK